MPELAPLPLVALLRRAFEELERNESIFDLPAHRFFVPGPEMAVRIHGRAAAAPLGPSAGPHTQMAQNIALAWLAGARVFELKTVQRNDRIHIPRPCIEVRDHALNVEWSQELRLEQSLEEYVKASMLVEILGSHFHVAPGSLFDMSVGYDLEGICSESIVAFLRGLIDARGTVDRLRRTLPRPWRDLDFTTAISNSVTLSTFHGCPVSEIERIATFLMTEIGVDCTLKLNPTLLGREDVLALIPDELHVPPGAFDNDPEWEEALGIVERLRTLARGLGRSFAIKLTNTLVVENHSTFLPRSESLAYLSGPPLHAIAMHLVQRFRDAFGRGLPISFSAGIDRRNYPDAVALGLAPVTVCTDLLKPGGYSRLHGYGIALADAMREVGASNVEEFAREDVAAYLKTLPPRFRPHPRGSSGRELGLFDCSTCDLCISVCPNDALMRLPSLACAIPFTRTHQLATFADFCNECGTCETVCPDEGSPQHQKLRYFGSEESWERQKQFDGFWIGPQITRARIDGTEVTDENHPLVDYARRAALDRTFPNYIHALEGA